MAATIPTTEPATLRAGDTWRWTRTLADYPAGSWVLKYRFKNAAGGFEVTTTTSGADHSVSVAAATTAAYTAGRYTWVAWVEGGSSEKYTVDEGTVEVEADYRAGAATVALDDRSFARKALDLIEAGIVAHGSNAHVQEYEIAGRRMKFKSLGELMAFRDQLKAEVAKEEDAARLAAGLGSKRQLLVRFGNGR